LQKHDVTLLKLRLSIIAIYFTEFSFCGITKLILDAHSFPILTILNEIEFQDRPGKPRRLDTILEVVSLTWDPPSDIKDGDYYQISYKELEHDGKWTLYDEVFQDATAELNDLRANTVFVFRVRVIYEDREGPFSEESNEIRTSLSAACQVSQQSVSLVKGNFSPPVYGLPMNEIMRHETSRINKLEFSKSTNLILFEY
jgi:hypothetical protein